MSMTTPGIVTLVTIAICLLGGCAAPTVGVDGDHPILIARMGDPAGDAGGFEAIRTAFCERNEGYDVAFIDDATRIPATTTSRVVFVQEPSAGQRTVRAEIAGGAGTIPVVTETGGGDIVLLRPGVDFRVASALDFLVFVVPGRIPDELPPLIRPDWDELITDTPGGCATETGAYRRILLTWLEANGPYTYHALNAHRVRITDSFSHYHPLVGGFDEFYFVQMVQPDGRIIVSGQTDRIEHADTVTREDAGELLETHPLFVGDLVYIPRGVVHRGVGGVLTQVITVPGFRPGAEIGIDHHLRAINERLDLDEFDALPYNEEASVTAVIR